MKIRTTLLASAFCCWNMAMAEKIEIDGIYYNIGNDGNAEVTYKGDEEDGWMYYSADELYCGDVEIPNQFEYKGKNYAVKSIGKDAFAGSKLMTSVYFPATLETIGNGCFTLCQTLEKIDIEEDNENFFSYKGILYSKNPTSIFFVPRAIAGDLELNNEITTIPSAAFQNCKNITTILLPDGITTIQDGAFNSCTNLEEIFFNDGLTTIGEYAFSKCNKLNILSFPNSLTTIKAAAFTDCTNLNYVLVHDGLETIGKMAFYNCQNILGIELPSTLKSIGDQAFDLCYSLDVVLNNSNLVVTAGSTTNGHVAYYATEVIDSKTETGLLSNGKKNIYLHTDGTINVTNATGKNVMIYDYNGRLLMNEKIDSELQMFNIGKHTIPTIR